MPGAVRRGDFVGGGETVMGLRRMVAVVLLACVVYGEPGGARTNE